MRGKQLEGRYTGAEVAQTTGEVFALTGWSFEMLEYCGRVHYNVLHYTLKLSVVAHLVRTFPPRFYLSSSRDYQRRHALYSVIRALII